MRYQIILVLLLGFCLRLFRITLNDIWTDEAYSYFLSLQSIPQIIRGTITDQHPPFYYILLHYWLLIGHDLFILRLLSVMIGTTSIALIYRIGKHMVNSSVGLTASFLLSISPIHIWYSQETRMYILLILLTMLSSYLCWQILYTPTPPFHLWLWLVITNLIAIYTHNTAIFIVIFQNLVWSLYLVIYSFTPMRSWVIAQMSIGVGYAFWIPVVYIQATQHPMPWIAPPSLETARHILYNLIFGENWNADIQHYIGIVLLITMLLFTILTIIGKKQYFTMSYVFSWVLIPLLLITLVSFQISLYQKKQFLIIVPPLILLFAIGINYLNLFKLVWLIAIIGLIWPPLHSQYTIPTKTKWSQVALHIDKEIQSNDIIYLNAGAISLPLNFYLTTDAPQAGYPHIYSFEHGGWHGKSTTSKLVDKALNRLTQTHARIWLIEYGSNFWDPQALIPTWLDTHTHRLTHESISNVSITLYQTKSN